MLHVYACGHAHTDVCMHSCKYSLYLCVCTYQSPLDDCVCSVSEDLYVKFSICFEYKCLNSDFPALKCAVNCTLCRKSVDCDLSDSICSP